MVSTGSTTGSRSSTRTTQVDPRGQRFAATLTALVLLSALVVSPSTVTVGLVALQLVVFAIGALAGPARTPYAWLFRTLVRPRLGAPRETEDARPPRFAQAVGLGFATVSLVGYVVGLPLVGAIAAALALAAAFLNAAFGYCLGCEIYLLLKRASRPAANPGPLADH
jgi:uncharacterized membrane protein YjdF